MFSGKIAAQGRGGKEFPPLLRRELCNRLEFQRWEVTERAME